MPLPCVRLTVCKIRDVRDIIEPKWTYVQSSDFTLSIGTRNGPGSQVNILLDTTSDQNLSYRDFSDDPTYPGQQREKFLWYMICEVTFGQVQEKVEGKNPSVPTEHRLTDQGIKRADLQAARILVFHADNKKAAGSCRKHEVENAPNDDGRC